MDAPDSNDLLTAPTNTTAEIGGSSDPFNTERELDAHANVSAEDAAWADAQVDPEYEAYLQERAAEADALLQADSHTKPYLAFVTELFTNVKSLEFTHSSYLLRRKQLSDRAKKIEARISASPPEEAYLHLHELELERDAIRDLDGAFVHVMQSQRQLYYANLINILENYVIDVCKLMLVLYPTEVSKKLNKNLAHEFTYGDLLPHLGNPAQLADHLLNTLIESSERAFTLDHVLGILLNWHQFTLLDDERLALKRAAQVRHKITHRYGKVDGKFISDIKSMQLKSGSATAYSLVGMMPIKAGDTYRVSVDEFTQARTLVEKVAAALEHTVVGHYPRLIAYDPFDWNFHMEDLERGIADWVKLI
ncbi:hypothetical protein [Deinococcus arcticus]|uniref:Uncharacterized protein n=1 Tax=Deinococcus arcticus TaxID=2136176 RepID=A0A2T3W653_9DEIO|nr:hypothetical protein [Deinococcus arcticus]PTA67371.1 hypothetical protein C8263_12400 [Deinococcus arcticus]